MFHCYTDNFSSIHTIDVVWAVGVAASMHKYSFNEPHVLCNLYLFIVRFGYNTAYEYQVFNHTWDL